MYDWSSIDTQLAQAEAHGKKVVLGIASGGLNVPDWLLANYPDIQTFSFIDPNPYQSDVRTATYDTCLLGSDLSG